MELITLYATQALIGAGVLVGIGAIAFLLTNSSNKKNTKNYEKPMLVEKQEFIIPSYKTVGGKEIKDLRIGWEAYGTLNADKSNVILVPHYFSGTSHAAGKYDETDELPGYWDLLIGPEKAIDTNEYYVIAVDSLCNVNVHDPKVITTGPASINPETGKPYGMDFPVITIRDFVEVQRELLDSLGIDKLHAVVGPSMGSLQAYEWAAAYPERVERLVPVIGSGWANSYLIGWLGLWAEIIQVDQNWNNGDYYDGAPPIEGIRKAVKLMTLHAWNWQAMHQQFKREWADAGQNPLHAIKNKYAVEAHLDEVAEMRSSVIDANHLIYLAKACQLYTANMDEDIEKGLSKLSMPTLLIYQEDDLIFPGGFVRETAEIIARSGGKVEEFQLKGVDGHMDGLLVVDQAFDKLRAFLSR